MIGSLSYYSLQSVHCFWSTSAQMRIHLVFFLHIIGMAKKASRNPLLSQSRTTTVLPGRTPIFAKALPSRLIRSRRSAYVRRLTSR